MEVLQENVALLSNYEVFDILQNMKFNKKHKVWKNRAEERHKIIKYLKDTACTRQTPEKIRDFLKAMEPYNLLKCEKLMLLNLCPTTPIEIQLMIEDSEIRLDDEAVESILATVTQHLGLPKLNQDEQMEQ